MMRVSETKKPEEETLSFQPETSREEWSGVGVRNDWLFDD